MPLDPIDIAAATVHLELLLENANDDERFPSRADTMEAAAAAFVDLIDDAELSDAFVRLKAAFR